MNFLLILLIIFGALWTLSILLYIPKFISWGYGFKKMPRLKNPNKARIALVIAAKDEEDAVAPLFDSINKQTYPKDLYHTFLVVDSLTPDTDKTVILAKEKLLNSTLLVEPPQNSKGSALNQLFKNIMTEPENQYDAYIIVDADNILTPNFIEEMNNALASNADVIIGKKIIKNWESKDPKHRNLVANVSALTYTGIDTMGNKYKTLKGYSLTVCGQGVMLTHRFINHFGGFPFTSLTEDTELNIEAILNDFPQYYYEYAELYAEEPITRKEYNKRRYRWLKGYFSCNAKYTGALLKKTFSNGKVDKRNLNFLFELYPIYFMFASAILATFTFLVSAIVLTCLNSTLLGFAWWLTGGWLLLFYLMIAFFNFMLVIECGKDNKMSFKENLAVIILGPILTVEYGIVLLRVINKNYKVKWEKVERIKLCKD